MSEAGAVAAGLLAAHDAGAIWRVDAALLPALRASGWLDPDRIDAALATATGASGRAPIAIVSAGDRALALRGVRHGGVLRGVLGARLAGPARPLDEIAATARLQSAGAPVPRPAFAGAWRRGIAWRGVVATHFEVGTQDGERFLRAAAPATRLRAAASAGRAVRRFHDAGGWHADLHVGNLLVREREGTDPLVLVIDLDRARVLASVDARARMAQLMRLYRSLRKRRLLDRVGTHECAAFFRAYVAHDRALRRAMIERLPAERRRVARHALLYR